MTEAHSSSATTGEGTTEETAIVVAETGENETVAGTEMDNALAKLAQTWGATISVDKRGSRKPSSKARPAKRTVNDAPLPIIQAQPPTETAPVVDTRSSKVKLLDSIARGQKLKAMVSHVQVGVGAFLKVVGPDGGSIPGLLHFSCVPGNTDEEKKAFIKALRYKQMLDVTVVDKDMKAKNLKLTMVADEKSAFIQGLKPGMLLEGSVVSNRENGARVNIGLTTAFMHVTQVDGESREERDANLAGMKPSTKVTVVVTEVNVEKQEVRVSQRLLPLAAFAEGQEVTGSLVRYDKGTAVLALEGGVKGLVPKSKLGGDPAEKAVLKAGEGTLTGTVVSVDFKEALVLVTTRKGQ
jgi:ribosomal protein S1